MPWWGERRKRRETGREARARTARTPRDPRGGGAAACLPVRGGRAQISSAVWLVWSGLVCNGAAVPCRAVPCAQPSHARDPRGVNAAAPGVHARREWPYYPVGRAWARIASRRRRYPADRRTSAGAWCSPATRRDGGWRC